MAVITRYVVVRNGIELDQVFSVKKEAEAYDKMLDAAENLAGFIKSSEFGVPIDEPTIDAIAILLAKNGPEVVKIQRDQAGHAAIGSRCGRRRGNAFPVHGKKDPQERSIQTTR